MIIRSKRYGYESNVYGLTFGNGKTYFLHFGKSCGLTVVAEDEYEVVDSALQGEWYFSKMPDEKTDALLHKCLLDKNLLNRLFEHEPDAFREFNTTLRALYPVTYPQQ